MNKKMNTVVFVIAGTVVNLLLAFLSIFALLFVVGKIAPYMGKQSVALVPFAFVGGIVIAMIVYQRLTRWVITRFNLNDKLDPLFTARHRRKK